MLIILIVALLSDMFFITFKTWQSSKYSSTAQVTKPLQLMPDTEVLFQETIILYFILHTHDYFYCSCCSSQSQHVAFPQYHIFLDQVFGLRVKEITTFILAFNKYNQ